VPSERFVQVLALNRAGAVIGRSVFLTGRPARWRMFGPDWALRLRHAVAKAGLRCAETWSELLHWAQGR
jgi:hypothetical protein